MATSKSVLAVTGATGFVGRHFIERILLEKKFRIRCLVRRNGDISNLQSLHICLSKAHNGITHCFADRGGGSIVNIASLSAVRADYGFAVYNASRPP